MSATLTCPSCSTAKTFRYPNQLKLHIETVHSSELYDCNFCHYKGKSKNLVKLHLNRKHDRNFKCDRCDKTFGYQSELNRHAETHSLRCFKCQICEFLGKSRRAIEEHHKSVHVPKFKCDKCDKTFAYRSGLSRHAETHSLKWFDCEFCEFLGKNMRAIEEHCNRVHEPKVK